MRFLTLLLLLLGTLALVGCRGGNQSSKTVTDAGVGNYCQRGPMGLSVESARLGKVRMRGFMRGDGESRDDVFTIRTRFKLLDPSVPVKQFGLQMDGSMMSGGGLKLLDEAGRSFKPVAGFGFDSVHGRRSGHTILNANTTEATDVLTFESVASATGSLTLEVPANYQVQQPDGTFMQPKEPGTYRIHIPPAFWAEPPASEIGPGKWATVGPISVAVESVKLGKVQIIPLMTGPFGPKTAESRDDIFTVNLRVKLTDASAQVKKMPFISDGLMGSTTARLRTRAGEDIPVLGASGFDRIVGRQKGEVEFTRQKPEGTDVLTFDARAGRADELILTLWPKWQERKPDGSWASVEHDGEFRFRIPRSAWAN